MIIYDMSQRKIIDNHKLLWRGVGGGGGGGGGFSFAIFFVDLK